MLDLIQAKFLVHPTSKIIGTFYTQNCETYTQLFVKTRNPSCLYPELEV